jgi:hypothetical protein
MITKAMFERNANMTEVELEADTARARTHIQQLDTEIESKLAELKEIGLGLCACCAAVYEDIPDEERLF